MKAQTLALLTLALMFVSESALAQKKKSAAAPPEAPTSAEVGPTVDAKAAEEGESVDVSKITEKYWAQGKETELGVVQNRRYTSANRLEFSLLTGVISSDPFLSVNHFGGTLGYHFSQYFSAHFIGWKSAVAASDALKTFERETSVTVNTNHPKAFYGLQLNQNFLYGKASLFGKAIIYVDLYILGGLGWTDTQSGSYVTPFLGIGQKIHLNKFMALDLNYRIMRYSETILAKYAKPGVSIGDKIGERSNSSDAVSVGISFFW